MAKRLFDIFFSFSLIILLLPFFLAIALLVYVSDPGPVFYRCERVGRFNKIFKMHKFRSMYMQSNNVSVITALNDERIFPVGKIIRKFKLDELPQLWDVLIGNMAIVGPRPEDPKIVEFYYTEVYMETLSVKPGLASPGSIFNYTHGERMLDCEDPELAYVEKLLPKKMQLELRYVRRSGIFRDFFIIFKTIFTILSVALGRKHFPVPGELLSGGAK